MRFNFLTGQTGRVLNVLILLAIVTLSAFDTPLSQAQTSSNSNQVPPGNNGTVCDSGSGFSLSGWDNSLVARLRQTSPGPVQISCHASTGKVRFVSTAPGKAFSRSNGLAANASPEQAARDFMGQYGSIFGIANQATELSLVKTLTDQPGVTFIRFQQVYQSVPVLGGEVIAQVNSNDQVVSVGGELTPTPAIDMTPKVTADQARQTALAYIASYYRVSPTDLQASQPALWLYDSRLLNNSTMFPHTLTWRLEVTPSASSHLKEAVRELVLVDAQVTGKVALNFNQIADAKSRTVCDLHNTQADPADCNTSSPKLVRIEGSPPSGDTDIDQAYNFAGATYDFYFNNFGRDSLDGNGLQLRSTVRYCYPASYGQSCPLANAFWNGTQMYYGAGFASADDVVGHELTHGFTQFTSGLFYYYQSGALNESLSDVFGEFVDQSDGVDGSAGSGANVKWLIGEDLPKVFYPNNPNGAIRSMKTPGDFSDPARMNDSNYKGGNTDQGGVHSNSGVNNKAAYLLTDGTIGEPGGTFNGQTITGLGLTKVIHLYYELETHLLTSGSDYQDVYDYLQQACRNLTGTYGITAADCLQVKKVVDATEMYLTPPNAPAPEAPVCAAGLTQKNLFADDLENINSGNWASSVLHNTYQVWYYPGSVNNLGQQKYATSGVNNFWGDDTNTRSDAAIAMQKSVTVPNGAFMRFRHAYDFYNFFGLFFLDGGIVEYSTNNGATWQDAGSLISDNPYNSTIDDSSNPLGARNAFTGTSNGYYSSRLNLSSLAGQSVRFRFRLGTSSISGGSYGWFIDDIAIYTCSAPTSVTLNSSNPNANVGQNVTFTANVTGPPGLGTPTGSVTFKEGNSTLGSSNLNGSGVATLTTTLAAGLHTIVAYYTGTGSFADAVSNPINQVFVATDCANPLTVTTGTDDSTCGTLRLATNYANNNPISPASGKLIDLNGLAANTQITLTQGTLVIGPGVTVTRTCTAGPTVTIIPGVGVTGDGLLLNGVNLRGVIVRGFTNRQIVTTGQNNLLFCVKASKS